MNIHTYKGCRLMFGDKRTAVVPDELTVEQQQDIAQQLGLDALVTLEQQHTVQGLVITNRAEVPEAPRAQVGDFLVTNLPRIGLVVMTADCLPVIAYDAERGVVGIAHAGWRGTVGQIAVRMVEAMGEYRGSGPGRPTGVGHAGTGPLDIDIFFGPSIGPCCYVVGDNFAPEYRHENWYREALGQQGGRTIFDLVRANSAQLAALGCKRIHTAYWHCTACSANDCSYRRSSAAPQRQLTIVALG